MDYWELINIGGKYECDRCKVAYLREDEYYDNFRVAEPTIFHYCEECWRYMHFQEWTDGKGHKHRLRSERIVIPCPGK